MASEIDGGFRPDRRDYYRAHAPPLPEMFWSREEHESGGDYSITFAVMAGLECRWRHAYADAMLAGDAESASDG